MANKNLAKKKATTVKKVTIGRKSKANKVDKVNEVIDSAEKAKETVDNLLKDIPMEMKSADGLLELDENEVTEEKGDNWLQDQVSKLVEENEKLRDEASTAKSDYEKLFSNYRALKDGDSPQNELIPDSIMKKNVIALFDEVQNNYTGRNATRTPYKNMSTQHLLQKLIVLFPFTEELKRF